MKQIAIIGAGYTGLSAAYRLSSLGHSVTIYEADAEVGGLASGIKQPHWQWSVEKYYHHWFTSDSTLLGLVKDLGLSDLLITKRPTTVLFHDAKFYPLDSIKSILNFPGFSLTDLPRFSLVTAYLKYLAKPLPLEHHTAHDWLSHYYGSKLYDQVWQPMLQGKFGESYRDVNMAWMWARLKARTPDLGTFKGGFQNFADKFAHILVESHGVNLHLSTPIKHIQPQKSGLKLTTSKGSTFFDHCLITASPKLAASLVPSLPQSYLNKLTNLNHLGAIVALYSLGHPLSPEGYYWYNLPKNQDFPFLALVEHTNFVDKKYFGGDHLIYCGDYYPQNHPYFSLSKSQLISKFNPAFKRINPNFKSSWINQTWVFKTPYAQPIPGLNHSQHIPSLTTPINNIFLANMSQVYPWDRGTNFALKLGLEAASIIHET